MSSVRVCAMSNVPSAIHMHTHWFDILYLFLCHGLPFLKNHIVIKHWYNERQSVKVDKDTVTHGRVHICKAKVMEHWGLEHSKFRGWPTVS